MVLEIERLILQYMEYKNVVEAKFISRPNRFIGEVELDGNIEYVHIKNTGQCREVLLKDARVFLEPSNNPNRKTKYTLDRKSVV